MRIAGIYPHTRRQFIGGLAGVGVVGLLGVRPSLAANPTGVKLHGLSSFGDLKYAPDYKQFDFASPGAPKGGTFVFTPSYWFYNQNTQTFNTLNTFVLRGEAPPRMELCYDSLMVWAIDEPDALYCAVARSVEISPDRNTYRFELRKEARFNDGTPITAADVAFSYNIIQEKGHPQLSQDLRDLDEAVAVDPHTFELRFNGRQSDRAILAIAHTVPILSASHFADREFDASTLDPVLGSGPWKVGRFSAGKFVEYERAKDYWARQMPFAIGLNHFDTIRIDFFRDRVAPFEAFKKGEILWRQEFTSKVWATEYNFPAAEDGRVVKREFPDELRPSMQAWAVNTRRAKFADPRTRQAIGLCFDFEWTNRNLFYGAYARSQSLFETSDFKAEGRPSADELALLEPFRSELPAAVFGPAISQPVSDGSGSDRSLLRQAVDLLSDAGWRREDGRLVNDAGDKLTIEFLIRAPVFERILGKYVENMRQVGIEATIRLVDPSQFQARLDEYDFDMMGIAFSFAASPTAESMRQFFHSDAAARPGAYNYPGATIPAVDALIDELAKVTSREQLVTAMRAIDRVMRAHHVWIPNWFSASHRIAIWDMFGWKEPKPDYHFPVEQLWWYDEDKARAIGKA